MSSDEGIVGEWQVGERERRQQGMSATYSQEVLGSDGSYVCNVSTVFIQPDPELIRKYDNAVQLLREAGTVLFETGMTPAALADKADAGEKFKTFVHAYLDEHGVPHGDPANQHQMEGCRIGARLDLMFAEKAALAEQNRQLRVLLAGACSGVNLYSDDGELQDNSTRPYIDFLRMSPTELGAAFYERAKAKIALARNETE